MMTPEGEASIQGKSVSSVVQAYMEPLISEWQHAGGKSIEELNNLLENP